VLSRRLKAISDGDVMTSDGRLFQTRAAETAKAVGEQRAAAGDAPRRLHVTRGPRKFWSDCKVGPTYLLPIALAGRSCDRSCPSRPSASILSFDRSRENANNIQPKPHKGMGGLVPPSVEFNTFLRILIRTSSVTKLTMRIVEEARRKAQVSFSSLMNDSSVWWRS